MTKTVASDHHGVSVFSRDAKERIRRAAAMPFMRKRFVLNIPALNFGFVSDFVFRI
jgi:hypothetical protein